jgi:hypothetical protein
VTITTNTPHLKYYHSSSAIFFSRPSTPPKD